MDRLDRLTGARPTRADAWVRPYARTAPQVIGEPTRPERARCAILAPMFLARVYVTLKPTVNDPPGLTIRGGLHSLGFTSVDSVRSGKYMEIRLDARGADDARAQVNEMCRKLLANPVIEDYRFELEEVAATAT